MPALFGDTRSDDKTVLLVDVENGSVASALVRLSSAKNPKLFAEHRTTLPIPQHISSAHLARKVLQAVEESISHTSQFAARMRQNKDLASTGTIQGAQLFFGPPWNTLSQDEGRLQWSFEPSVVHSITRSVESIVGLGQVQFHPFGRAAAQVAGSLTDGPLLVCVVTGEILELLLVEDGRVRGRATVPIGVHTVLRTLQVHAGLSMPEVRSAFRLYQETSDDSLALAGPLRAAAHHFGDQFVSAAEELLQSHPVSTSIIVAPERMGEWFARALAEHDTSAQLFPHGGVTRDIRAKHLVPLIDVHATHPDVHLMIGALFIHSLQGFEHGIK